MTKIDKKYEILSAYIDGELSEDEKNKLEQKIILSKELQGRLAELNKIKQLTVQAVKPISESLFFETRLMQAIKTNKRGITHVKKWLPALGFVILTAALMVVLKLNPQIIDNLVENQKNNIADFYKQNLKPLLFAANLSNEDIFNFAFYKQLPLDNEKHQYLRVGSDPNGTEYFEIKNAGLVNPSNNLENFITNLKLNSKQREQIDSILETYAEGLQSQVLVNDKNTVAINPNLWNYNKAIAADIISFASSVNKKGIEKIIPAAVLWNNNRSIAKIVKEVKQNRDKQYIFFTPDTIFSEAYNFDEKQFKTEMKKMKEELKRNLKDVNNNIKQFTITLKLDSNIVRLKRTPSWDKNFQVYFDTNSCRVHLHRIDIPQITLPNFDSIAAQIEEATKNLNTFSFTIPDIKKRKGNFKFKYEFNDSTKSFNFDLNSLNLDSLMKLNKNYADSILKNYSKYHKINPDSLASMFNYFDREFPGFLQQKEFQQQMKELQKEMEKFRKEIERLQKNLPKTKTIPKKAETLEI